MLKCVQRYVLEKRNPMFYQIPLTCLHLYRIHETFYTQIRNPIHMSIQCWIEKSSSTITNRLLIFRFHWTKISRQGTELTRKELGKYVKYYQNLIHLGYLIRKQPLRCSGKKDVLRKSCQVKFVVRIIEKYLWRSSFLVKLQACSLQLY